MEEDLQRELDRNAAATQMAMAREVEAQAAKKRCNSSHNESSSYLSPQGRGISTEDERNDG